MTYPSRRLVLAVDADPAFLEDARLLLQGQRILTARSVDEAAEIVAGGRVDVVLLGPSFGNESAVIDAGALRSADPEVVVVLAANIVTNRILLGAMRSGVADVLDTPLTLRKLDEALARVASPTTRTPAVPPVTVAATPIPALERRAEPPLVTISFEAESGPSTPSSLVTGPVADHTGALPPRGPLH